MKLNNKGFAISSIMYIILILAVILISVTLAILSSRKLILDKIKKETTDNIYGISYNSVINTLKHEAISYTTRKNSNQENIKIENFETSVSQELLEHHELLDKYLTLFKNNYSYDVYLGKTKKVTDTSKPISNMLGIANYKIEGNSIQGKLPEAYQELEYIQNNGEQFIDTGVIPNNSTGIDVTYKAIDYSKSQYIAGSRGSAINYAVNGSASRTDWDLRFDGSVIYSNVERNDNIWRSIISMKNGKGTWTLSDLDTGLSKSFTISNKTVTTDLSLTIFSYNAPSLTYSTIHTGLRIYNFKIYDGDVLIRDLVPCYRKSDDVIGMYDLVNGVFYTNKGTGTFIKGKSILSPNTPVEVESVGDKTKNLINPNATLTSIVSTYLGIDAMKYVNQNVTLSISLKEGKSVPEGVYFGVPYKLDGITAPQALWLVNNGEIKYTTFNLKQVGSATAMGIGVYPATQANWDKIFDAFNVQLEFGTTKTDYEPYGYKIPVKVSGKNLFNVDTYGELKDSNKHPCALDISKFSVGTKITISTKDEYYYKISNTAGGAGTYQYKANNYTFTLNKAMIDLGYLFIISPTTWSPETKENLLNQNVLIEYGSTATAYEPYAETVTTNIYLDEPLRKIGDYADYIDFENKTVVRKVGVQTYNGTEEWIKHTTTKEGYGVFRNESLLTPLIGAPISSSFMTHFNLTYKAATADFVIGEYRFTYSDNNINGSSIYVSAEQTTVEDFAEWLSNNNVSIYYPLDTSTTTNIKLPDILLDVGSSMIEINTGIIPSNVEFTIIEKIRKL